MSNARGVESVRVAKSVPEAESLKAPGASVREKVGGNAWTGAEKAAGPAEPVNGTIDKKKGSCLAAPSGPEARQKAGDACPADGQKSAVSPPGVGFGESAWLTIS